MAFNSDELIKIHQATDGIFKKKARRSISRALSNLTPKIILAKLLSPDEAHNEFKILVNEYTSLRQEAVNNGANSYGHFIWASATACESWLHGLLINDKNDLERVENSVKKLIERTHKPEITRSEAALAARGLAWEYFENGKLSEQSLLDAKSKLEKELNFVGNCVNITQEDWALILLQAIHFISFHEVSIKNHISALEAYHRVNKMGGHLNFGSDIANYINDIPCLTNFSK